MFSVVVVPVVPCGLLIHVILWNIIIAFLGMTCRCDVHEAGMKAEVNYI